VALAHIEGATEPWVQDLLCGLLQALHRPQPVVLECGGFQGHTSQRLAQCLQALGGGTLHIAEWDPEAPERADQVDAVLGTLVIPDVTWRVLRADAITVIATQADASLDFVYLDDDHTPDHVRQEIIVLGPKMRPGGLITGHDVFGSCGLQVVFREFGGYALDLPRLGPAGGLGILQL
jgi:predicted O-methyltransferase YrrM